MANLWYHDCRTSAKRVRSKMREYIANSTEVMWGPGFIGYIIATVLYGTSFGQYIFYLRSFPQDSKKLKSFIMTVFLFETIHQCAMMGIYWSILISCRRSTSLECTNKLPWQMLASTFVLL
ncbi:hypothetical protein EDB19DRAFT_1142956 [Suillus lakei]|nr:hypothetical protein EDB19DRAFT_1142956 [Suillus lakei]